MPKDNANLYNPSDYKYSNREAKITSAQIVRLFNNIAGQMLTIADATSENEKKTAAVASLIRTGIYNTKDEVLEWMYNNGRDTSQDQAGEQDTFPF